MGHEISPEKAKAAYELASSEVNQIVSSEDLYSGEAGAFRRTYLSKLCGMTTDERFRHSIRSLGRSCLVNTWNSLEIFSKDLFVLLFNKKPQLYDAFEKNAEASKRFETRRVSISDLAKFNFDVSKSVGSLLFSSRDFSDVSTIKAAVDATFCENGEVQRVFSSSALYTLCKKRHLIVHRRGIVDESFKKYVHGNYPVGEELIVSSEEIVHSARTVFDAAVRLISAVRSLENT